MQRLMARVGIALIAVALAGCADAPVDGSAAAPSAASGAPTSGSTPPDTAGADTAGADTAGPGPAGPGPAAPGPAAPDAPDPGTPDPGAPGPAAPGPGAGSPLLPALSTPAGAPGNERALPVYYVAQTAAGPRLQREFRRLGAAQPASAAVTAMLAAPTGTDPDYRNPWPAGTTLRTSVAVAADAITVDLSAPPPSDLAAQQLVFTAQGALGVTTPVRLLHDGAPVGPPIRRANPYTVRSLVQIDNPTQGARTGSPVTVTGEAAVFEATLHWTVERDGATVGSGVATTARGQAFAPFRFSVPLPPGRYVVRISEDGSSGGAGRPVLTDDKSITVGGP